MSDDQPSFIFEQLRSEGVLWAINRSCFHPRGFALGLEYAEVPEHRREERRAAIKRGEIDPIGWRLYGYGDEPWVYVDKSVEACFDGLWKPGVEPVDESASFASFEALLALHRGLKG